MEDLKLIAEALNVANQKGCFTLTESAKIQETLVKIQETLVKLSQKLSEKDA
jgi:hypothetical protein